MYKLNKVRKRRADLVITHFYQTLIKVIDIRMVPAIKILEVLIVKPKLTQNNNSECKASCTVRIISTK